MAKIGRNFLYLQNRMLKLNFTISSEKSQNHEINFFLVTECAEAVCKKMQLKLFLNLKK